MTTRLFGERVPRVEDARLVTGAGRFLDDLGHDALEVAFVRSPHAHARIVEIDVADALEVEGLVAIYTHEDLDGRTGGDVAAADPAPDADPRPHAVRPGQGRGQLRRRGDRDGRGEQQVRRRGRRGPGPRGLRVPARCRRRRGGPGRRAPGARGRPRQRRRGDGAGGRRRGGGDRRGTARPRARPVDRAECVDAPGGQGGAGPLGPRRPVAAGAHLDADFDERAAGDRSEARSPRRQGRGGDARRRWRLRREDRAPLARGGAGAVGRAAARAAGEVDRGPARALHLQRPRAGSAAPRARRVRRRRPVARALGAVLARQRRLHPLRTDRADHHQHPAARALQAGCVPGRVPQPLHEHRDRHALPRCRPTPGLLRHGARDGRDRRRPRHRPDRRTAEELHHPRRDALRPGTGLPGRSPAGLRLRRLPGLAREAQGARRVGRLRDLPRAGTRRGAPGRDRPRLLRRGHRRRALRRWAHPRRDRRQRGRVDGAHVAGPGAPDDARADRRRRARGAVRHDHRHDRGHPAGSSTPSGRSRRGPR